MVDVTAGRPAQTAENRPIIMPTWIKNLTWGPFALAYIMPALLGLYTVAAVRDWPIAKGHDLLLTWVGMIVVQLLLVIIGCTVINEHRSERFHMALLHAIVSFTLGPVMVLLPVWWLGIPR